MGQITADFLWRMEDVLDLYAEPYDPCRPAVCFVEIEFSILVRQCLNRRLPERGRVQQEVEAWARARNAARATVQWRFTTTDARLKVHRLYPQ